MLSYLHEFHAGNHADILKHIALVQILRHLNAKESPYTFFDTHAGSALYSLECASSKKTREAEKGILTLRDFFEGEGGANLAQDKIPECVKFYFEQISQYLKISCYPGSPLLERNLMRRDSRLFLCELHPREIERLRENIFEKNSLEEISIEKNEKNLAEKKSSEKILIEKNYLAQNSSERNANLQNARSEKKFCATKIIHADGLKNLFSSAPPQIKRGAVLIDPPYEDLSEFDAVSKTVRAVHKKWSAGIIAIWYPLLEGKKSQIEKMLFQIEDAAKNQNAHTEILRAEFFLGNRPSQNAANLLGSGMLVLNAPWKLDSQLREALEFLCGAIYEDASFAIWNA